MAKAIILAVIPQGMWQFWRVTTSMQKGEALLPKRLQSDLFIMCDTYSDCSIYLKLNYLFSYLFAPTGAPFFKLQGKTSTTYCFLSRWHNSHSRSLKQYQVSMQLKSAKKQFNARHTTHRHVKAHPYPIVPSRPFQISTLFSISPPTHTFAWKVAFTATQFSKKNTLCIFSIFQ